MAVFKSQSPKLYMHNKAIKLIDQVGSRIYPASLSINSKVVTPIPSVTIQMDYEDSPDKLRQ